LRAEYRRVAREASSPEIADEVDPPFLQRGQLSP
jgi:hypothetical protein